MKYRMISPSYEGVPCPEEGPPMAPGLLFHRPKLEGKRDEKSDRASISFKSGSAELLEHHRDRKRFARAPHEQSRENPVREANEGTSQGQGLLFGLRLLFPQRRRGALSVFVPSLSADREGHPAAEREGNQD